MPNPEVVEDEVPFEVTEETVVEGLDKVQQDILPIAQNVLGLIRKASVAYNKDKNMKYIKLELAIANGIPTVNTDGETEYRYRGKVVFPGMLETCFWADPNQKTSDFFKNKQHLLGFKSFCVAMGVKDLSTVKINDTFLTNLIDRHILFSIKHEEETQVGEDGKKVGTGIYRERVYGWKPAPAEE